MTNLYWSHVVTTDAVRAASLKILNVETRKVSSNKHLTFKNVECFFHNNNKGPFLANEIKEAYLLSH